MATPLRLFRDTFLIAISLYCFIGAFKPELLDYIDGANTLFHEAGHVFFSFLGEYIGIWGGTLFQLLLPGGIAVAFLRRCDIYAASIMFLWTSENYFSIARYIKDAKAQVLPYVGGEIHDWYYILSKWGLVEQDQLIGNGVWLLGLIGIVISCVIGLRRENV